MNLKINNREYPLHWGMGCFELYCDAMNCEIEDLDKAINKGPDQDKYLVNLILAAIKNGADIESIYDDFDVTYKQLQKFLDDAPETTLAKIMDDFKRSKYFGKTMAEYLFDEVAEPEPGATKKKLNLAK